MRGLLDTHAFLWSVLGDERLSRRARRLIEDRANELYVSAASAYEIAVKVGRGRLRLPESPDSYVPARLVAFGFDPLPISVSHGLRAAALPNIHGDPWDRLLVAQAQLEGVPILTVDPAISRYDVETIW
jgi:PIN domain nuclease of toxin-antitoxin system